MPNRKQCRECLNRQRLYFNKVKCSILGVEELDGHYCSSEVKIRFADDWEISDTKK